MESSLESALVSKIKESYAESQRLAEAAKQHVAGALGKAHECGVYLRESQQTIGATRWQQWFLDQDFKFKPVDAKRFMRLADGSLDRELSKQDLFAIGMLPEPVREDGSQKKIEWECKWLSAILKTTSAINHAREQAPLEEWPDVHKATLKEKLRPLVEIYATL